MGFQIGRFQIDVHRGQMDVRVNTQGRQWLIAAGGWFWRIEVDVTVTSSGTPAAPDFPTDFDVGFIQNVVYESAGLRYEGAPEMAAVFVNKPILDAERPGRQAWLTNAARVNPPPGISDARPVISWQRFQFFRGMRPLRVHLAIQDFPDRCFFNFFRGIHGQHPLRNIHTTTNFQLWLAAKPASSPPNMVDSYLFLATTDEFRIGLGITVTGDNPCFSRSLAADPTRLPNRGSIRIAPDSTEIRWRPFRAGDFTPTVSGPTANEILPRAYAGIGVAPESLPDLAAFTPCRPLDSGPAQRGEI